MGPYLCPWLGLYSSLICAAVAQIYISFGHPCECPAHRSRIFGPSYMGHRTDAKRQQEGSIAEISSWWDAGHLIDYEPVELSRLIEALFADTPLRAATISKILRT
jgi:hypothetical protein